MVPLIIGMGPAEPYPTDAWHPLSPSTANLAYLIVGDYLGWPAAEDQFDAINLNRTWYRPTDAQEDAIRLADAEETLIARMQAGQLADGRIVFLLGRKVTDFVFGYLRSDRSPLAVDAWGQLRKCTGYRLRFEDAEARADKPMGYYDFVAVPLWHPRNLTAPAFRMPAGWQQRMSNALRSAVGMPDMPFAPPPGKSGLQITDIAKEHRRRFFHRYQMELTQADLTTLQKHLFPGQWMSAIQPLRQSGLV